jgi:hypothetical protein
MTNGANRAPAESATGSPIVATGFQADQQRASVTELPQMLFKGCTTFCTGKHFYPLEQHVAPSVDAAAQWKFFPMSTPTKISIRLLVEVGIFIPSFLLEVKEGRCPNFY